MCRNDGLLYVLCLCAANAVLYIGTKGFTKRGKNVLALLGLSKGNTL